MRRLRARHRRLQLRRVLLQKLVEQGYYNLAFHLNKAEGIIASSGPLKKNKHKTRFLTVT